MTRDVTAFVRLTGNPPSLPAIYYELVRAVQHPDSSISTISNLILQDQGLTSRLLKIANSAYYGRTAEIGTIQEAVQLIGLSELQHLVLATSAIQAFDKLPTTLVDVVPFWEHSIACGLASALLAEQRNEPQPERLFIGGLLHDIGRLLMYLNAPDESRQVLERCQREAQLPSKVERDIFGFDHAMLGAELVTVWRLPRALGDMVGRHHIPSKTSSSFLDTLTVHFADFITSTLQFGSSGEFYVTPLTMPPENARSFPSGEQIHVFVSELDKRCAELFPVLIEKRA